MIHKRFAAYTWAVLGYNLLVVAWGAFVRATGSGAGCGSHWPLCNGTVVPRAPRMETLIELTHRATSGLALVAVVVLLVWALRAHPEGHPVRRGAVLSMAFIVLEALLGAGLVLFELVADNASAFRAFSMVAHLINTFLLIGCLALTAWWASGGAPVRLKRQGVVGAAVLFGVAATLIVGASGAIAALGDTLFPARSLAEGLQQDFSPDVHWLISLRKYHPLIAIGTGLYLVVAARLVQRARPNPATSRFASLLCLLVGVQLVAGVVNVVLLAPVWMQLLHLLLADLLWIALVLMGATALAARTQSAPAPARAQRLSAALS